MNAQDRAVVVSLLNYLSSKYLHTSDEVRAAAAHFNITLTTQHAKAERPFFNAADDARNFVVDVFRPNGPRHGERYDFPTQELADRFAAIQRGEPVATSEKAEAVTQEEAEAMFLDPAAIQDAVADGKHYIVAHPSSIAPLHKLHVNGCYHTFEEAQAVLTALPETRRISYGKLVVITSEEAGEPDAITFSKALSLFVDRYAVQDAHAVGKRYIVAIPSAAHDGKLLKHGTYYSRKEAQASLEALPKTLGIDRGQLVVLQK